MLSWWSWTLIRDPGGGVAEIEPAGTVKRLCRGCFEAAIWQDGVFVSCLALQRDGKAEVVSVTSIAQAAQSDHIAVSFPST